MEVAIYAGYITAEYYDDPPSDLFISDRGIIFMEQRFMNNIDGLLDYLGKIKSAIPFL